VTPTASDQIVERLIERGVDTVFGLPGDGINGFYEALRSHQDKVRLIHVRHEETAAMANRCLFRHDAGLLRHGEKGVQADPRR
jgi:thiamine pyrophosphate-dependent acetolactate synthase large subunit-like protein